MPAKVTSVGVRVACAEGISDLCQKNAEVMVLPADTVKYTAERSGTNVVEVGKSAHSHFALCTKMANVNDSFTHNKVTSRGVYELTLQRFVGGIP